VDALNPMTVWHYIAAEHYRYRQVRVRCDFFPFRGTATTATNSAATITLSVPHGTHKVAPQTGTPSAAGGIATSSDPIGGVPTHYHDWTLHTLGSVPTGSQIVGFDGSNIGHNGIPAAISTTDNITRVNLAPTAASHTVPIQQSLDLEHPTTLSGPLPQHTHDVEKRIPTGQPSPASITMTINGQALTAGAAVTGTRDASGAFTGSFVVNDISAALDLIAPGTDVPLVFSAGTSASNPFGVGFLQVTVTAVEELGGLTDVVRLTA
jgi:hypothetical protein